MDFRNLPLCRGGCGQKVQRLGGKVCIYCLEREGKARLCKRQGCNQRALKGILYCKTHALRDSRLDLTKNVKNSNSVKSKGEKSKNDKQSPEPPFYNDQLHPDRFPVTKVQSSRDFIAVTPPLYKNLIGPTLSAYMNCRTDGPKKDLYNVDQELNLTRASLHVIIKTYDDYVKASEALEALEARQSEVNLVDESTLTVEQLVEKRKLDAEIQSQKDALKSFSQAKTLQASKDLREGALDVIAAAEKAQNVYLKNAEILDIAQLPIIINQLVTILFRICGKQNNHIAKEFQEAIANELRLPGFNSNNQGAGTTAEFYLNRMAQSFTMDAGEVAKAKGLISEARPEEVMSNTIVIDGFDSEPDSFLGANE